MWQSPDRANRHDRSCCNHMANTQNLIKKVINTKGHGLKVELIVKVRTGARESKVN